MAHLEWRCIGLAGAAFASWALVVSLAADASAQFRKVDNVSIENLINASKVAVATLEKVGQPISDKDKAELVKAWTMSGEEAKGKIQDLMDPYCLMEIRIDEEAWMKAFPASADPADRLLAQGKWRAFLVKVYNESPVKADLRVRSPQAMAPEELKVAEAGHAPQTTDPHAWYRWLGLQLYPDAQPRMEFPGSMVSYLVLGVFSRDHGMRAADFEFYFGGGAVSQGHYVNRRLLFDVAAPQGQSPLPLNAKVR